MSELEYERSGECGSPDSERKANAEQEESTFPETINDLGNMTPDGLGQEDAQKGDLPNEEEYIPKSRFERVLLSVYRDEGLASILRLLSYTAVIATLYAFFYRIVVLIADKKYIELALLAGCLAISFVTVTVVRRFIDAKRPYELLPFYKEAPRSKKGRSFPSRHTFSIFAIGTALCYFSLAVGLILVALGILLAACRILLGYHFIRDTVAGALIGAVSGGLTVLFLALL